MGFQTAINFLYRFLLIPSIFPLLVLAFWPSNIAEKTLLRTGKLFVAKTILICVLVAITEMVAFKPLFQGSLLLNSFVISFIVYIALTVGLIYLSKDTLKKNKIAWAFLTVDILCWIPYFIWEITLGYVLFEDFNDYLSLTYKIYSKVGYIDYYSYLLIPAFITIIIFAALTWYSKKYGLQTSSMLE